MRDMRSFEQINEMVDVLVRYEKTLSWWNDEKQIVNGIIDGMLWAAGILNDDFILPEECKNHISEETNNEK